MDNNSNEITFSDVAKGVFIAIAIIIVMGTGYIMGILVSPNNGVKVDSQQQNFTVQNAENIKEVVINPVSPDAGGTTAPQNTTAPQQTTAQDETTTAKTAEDDKGSVAEKTTQPQKAENGEKTTAEIVKLFNDSANRIKGEATKVVKNYEYRSVDKEHLVVPDFLQSTAESLMTKFMGDDTDPIEYATAEEIAENYMVPAQSYVSKLTEADVAEATCKDNGTEYEIVIKVKDETNPTAGAGVGGVFDVIEASEVSAKVNFVKRFDTKYYDCVVKCKIDKATGRMTWANYTTPLVLDCTVNIIKTVDAAVGLTFEKDYNIFY